VASGGIFVALWGALTWWADYQARLQKEQADRSLALVIAKRDSQKPFLEKQLQFYFEAAKVTAKLATLAQSISDKGPGWEQSWDWAHRRFFELYWGELAVVESPEVAAAMVRFRGPLDNLKLCNSTPTMNCSTEQKSLEQLSLALASQIRKSIEQPWGIELPPLPK